MVSKQELAKRGRKKWGVWRNEKVKRKNGNIRGIGKIKFYQKNFFNIQISTLSRVDVFCALSEH
jgi:hypothetical protein